MPKQNQQLLLFLALQAGFFSKVKTSTSKIAGHFGISQQTASRKLRELKEAGLIELQASPSGCIVQITKKGKDSLHQAFLSLKALFEKGKKKELNGIVKTGLGEGRYYVSRPAYLEQFRQVLGFKPFFGTLNLVVEPAELRVFLASAKELEIQGFRTEERTFGKIHAFKVLVMGKQPASIIFPERTAHPESEIEVIAAANLRKKFRLKEGSRVFLKIA